MGSFRCLLDYSQPLLRSTSARAFIGSQDNEGGVQKRIDHFFIEGVLSSSSHGKHLIRFIENVCSVPLNDSCNVK